MAAQSDKLRSMREAPELGAVIRYHRKRSGLSQSELAALAGIGKTSVFDMENGKQTVRFATLLAALRALNISLTLTSPLMEACTQALKSSQDTTPKKGTA